MRRSLALIAACLMGVPPALALDMPARKAGLWELKMSFDNASVPGQTMRQCVDARTDKLMKANFGGSPHQKCAKQTVSRAGAAIVVDSECSYAGVTSSSHAVITGSFDSAYTKQITTRRDGGPPMPGTGPDGATHMTVAAKWLGPCRAGQRPGDMIMSNGMKVNILDMRKFGDMRPPMPQR